MTKSLDPFRFLLIAVSGWMNQQQLQLIDYLREENRVLREQLGQRRLRFNDDQRRRLAVRLFDARDLLFALANLIASAPVFVCSFHKRHPPQIASGFCSPRVRRITTGVKSQV